MYRILRTTVEMRLLSHPAYLSGILGLRKLHIKRMGKMHLVMQHNRKRTMTVYAFIRLRLATVVVCLCSLLGIFVDEYVIFLFLFPFSLQLSPEVSPLVGIKKELEKEDAIFLEDSVFFFFQPDRQTISLSLTV